MSNKEDALPAEKLRAVLHYDPGTGSFTRNGKVAGCLDRSLGYWLIGIGGHYYRAHRLAWLYMTGAWPPNQIDHINRDRADNRIANLRACTHAENMRNMPRRRRDEVGSLTGVRKHRRRFKAQITYASKTHYLGSFVTAEEAHAAYLARAKEVGRIPN